MNIQFRSVVVGVAALLALSAPEPEFHQGVEYRIEARLDEATHVLTGRARMHYTNHSPDTLEALYFHLHLNAFRPNSAWARRELQFNNRRFQDLTADQYAYDRISAIRIGDHRITPVFPNPDDSTVMEIALPAPLAPDASMTVDIDWTARLSEGATRRQGRKGRHYDFAQWYPRIAVYDSLGWETQTLLPQGEFFGEFASYDVTLDLPSDQIVAATGVAVSGDPGWQRVARDSTHTPWLRSDFYGAKPEPSLGLLGEATAGRKRVRWRAEHVHHFAWSTDPNYVYEGDRIGDVALHALFLPTDTVWPGSAIETMKQSVAFYDTVLGPYQYPQLTAVWRLDPGATEFPMFTSHSTPPAIVHETGHEWAHAMLANNEFKQGWLDEGFVSFLGFMYSESHGRTPNYQRVVNGIAHLDSIGTSQPLSLPSADFRDFNMYQLMTYTKPSLVLRMLRFYVGDKDFRAGLKLYFDENKLEHVDENDLKRAMETASDKNLDEFFQQWFHTTGTLDYAVTAAEPHMTNDHWKTRVTITRSGENWMPVQLKVGDKVRRLDSRERTFTVTVDTGDERPGEVVLDPDYILIDIVRGNNRMTL